MKRILVFLFLISTTASGADWPALLDEGMPGNLQFGAAIGGRDPFERNAGDEMAPASVAKLFTAGSALARLGADFRFPTVIRWKISAPGQASNILLIGSGDPTWGMKEFGEEPRARLDSYARALAENGVREISGPIQLEATDPRWSEVSFAQGWTDSDQASCDAAIAQAFNLNANCATYKVTALKAGNWETPGIKVPVELKLTAGSETKIQTSMVRSAFVLEGTYSQAAGPKEISLSIHNSRLVVKAYFIQALEGAGIRVLTTEKKAMPAGEDRELTFHSPTLAEILQPFLKNSVNFLGDSLLKAMAAQAGANSKSSLREAGLELTRGYLRAAGFKKGYTLFDGSGLSRSSLASPRLVLAYLSFLKAQPYFPVLWSALAIAGVDGTLKARMKGTTAEGVLRGKTGTLNGVYNLAGYTPNGSDFVPFVIFSKTEAERGKIIRVALDRAAVELVRIHGSGINRVLDLPMRIAPDFVTEHSGENHL